MDVWQDGTFYWNELMTHDPERAAAFFSQSLGWTFDIVQMPKPVDKYWVGMRDGKPVAGIMKLEETAPEGTPPHWLPYISVTGIDRRVRAAAQAGAQIIRAPFDVPSVGRIALLTDPTGALMGWMQPDDK